MADPEGVTGRRSALSPSKQELLAKRLAGGGAQGHSGVIGRRERKGPFPLSFAQQSLWILGQRTTFRTPTGSAGRCLWERWRTH